MTIRKTLLLLICLTGLIWNGFATCPTSGGSINNNGQSITIDPGESCVVTNFTVNGGDLIVNGSLTVSGSLSLSGSGAITVNGSLGLTGSGSISGNGDFTVNGLVNVGPSATFNMGGSGSAGGSGAILIEDGGSVDPDITSSLDNNTCVTNANGQECCGPSSQCPTLLPIVLGAFNVKAQGSSVSLNWQTITEENFDFFSVERSEDGDNFYEVGTVPGNGNSVDPIDYSFEDESPLYGMSYYRLNAIDYDGSYEKFPTLAVEFVPQDLQVSIYPNPNSGNNFKVRLGLPKKASIQQIVIYDLSGGQLFQSDLSLGRNDFNFQNLLESGLYFAKVQVDNFISTRKLIIN